jgi:hypothetical protein
MPAENDAVLSVSPISIGNGFFIALGKTSVSNIVGPERVQTEDREVDQEQQVSVLRHHTQKPENELYPD